MWANLISKYFPLQFHLLSRQQCEKPLWCFPRLRDRRQEELTSRLFSKSSAQQQPFRSCCGEKEQGGAGMRVAMRGPWCYLSVCPWLECWGESCLENVFIDGYIQVTLAKTQLPALHVSRLRVKTWGKRLAATLLMEAVRVLGNGRESLYPSAALFLWRSRDCVW